MRANIIPIAVSNANANPGLCAPCGGKCCKTMPGIVFPSELDAQLRHDIVADKVLALLETGRYALDWWDGNPFNNDVRAGRAYYLRPATRGNEGRWTDESYGGTCTFLGANGCGLEERQRPLECRALIPQANNTCYKPEGWELGGRRLGAQAWWPFREALAALDDLYWETLETKAQYADYL